MARDFRAEYRRRKAKAAAEGTTVFHKTQPKREAAARRRGYDSERDQRSRRKAGDLSFSDQAHLAGSPERGYVVDLGGDRRTWASPRRGLPAGLTRGDIASLHRTLEAAANHRDLEMRATATATWHRDPNLYPKPHRGSATLGGGYGQNVAGLVGADPDETLDRVIAALQGSEPIPEGGVIVHLSFYIFPLGEGRESEESEAAA